MSSPSSQKSSASFRDPSGFVFKIGEEYYRQINPAYKKDYDTLMSSGLYDDLTSKEILVQHKEVDSSKKFPSAYKIIKPDQIPFISYPYEWSFGALKDAALLTLEIETIGLKYGMNLKDASAYNIQFLNGKPTLIDTLSFERYVENQPWIAYKQFCQHFLAPLALMSLVDARLSSLSQDFIDGIPLDLTAKLLPNKARFSIGLLTHIFMHSRSQQSHSDSTVKKTVPKLPKNQLLGIIDNLRSTISSLKLPKEMTTWGDYYNNTNYADISFQHKESTVSAWIDEIKPKKVWDAGANNAHFSRLASDKKILTIATDFDPIAVEIAYQKMKKDNDSFILPLMLDLTNPSPAIGWGNTERDSFLERGPFDLTLILALVHHLAISNNLPFENIAETLSKHTNHLIIEFVPKNDSNTQRLLINRKNIFTNYDQKSFEKEFSTFFDIKKKIKIKESDRALYLLKKKNIL